MKTIEAQQLAPEAGQNQNNVIDLDVARQTLLAKEAVDVDILARSIDSRVSGLSYHYDYDSDARKASGVVNGVPRSLTYREQYFRDEGRYYLQISEKHNGAPYRHHFQLLAAAGQLVVSMEKHHRPLASQRNLRVAQFAIAYTFVLWPTEELENVVGLLDRQVAKAERQEPALSRIYPEI